MSAQRQFSACRHCGAAQPPDARFCPGCGARLGSDGTLELPLSRRAAVSAPRLHQVHRRPLGAHPVPFLAGAAAVLFVLGVLVFAVASWVAGIIVLAFWLGTVALFLTAVRREPDAPLARQTLAAATRVRSLGRLGTVTLRVWSRAGIELLHLTTRRYRLRRELGQQLRPLGDAVHRGEETRAQKIKGQAEQLEQALREADRASSAVIAGARTELDGERAAAGATQVIPTGPAAPTGPDGAGQDDESERAWTSSRSSSSS